MLDEMYFQSQEVIRITGVSNRQLQYWDETNFIKPSFKSTRRRRYTLRDIVLIKICKTIQDHLGLSIQELRRNLNRIRELLPREVVPLEDVVVYTDGENIIVAERGRYLNFSLRQNMLKFDLGEIIQWAKYVKENREVYTAEQLILSL
ncbi:MAG: MerR family transcriptional regulator [Candidatus Hydrogenedentota bacterium]